MGAWVLPGPQYCTPRLILDGVHNAAGKGIPNLWTQASQSLAPARVPEPSLRVQRKSFHEGSAGTNVPNAHGVATVGERDPAVAIMG
jgi:hypothetical protein